MTGYGNTIRQYWNNRVLQIARNDDGLGFSSTESTLSINSDFDLKRRKESKWFNLRKWKHFEERENTSSITLASRHHWFPFASILTSTIRRTKSKRNLHQHQPDFGLSRNTGNLVSSVGLSQITHSSSSAANEFPTSSKLKLLRFGTTFKNLWTLRFSHKRNVSCQDYWRCVNQE